MSKGFTKELMKEFNLKDGHLTLFQKRLKEKYRDIKKRSKIKEINFIVNHEPKPSKRPRKGKYTFYVPDAAKNKKEIRALIKDQMPNNFKKIDTEVCIDIKCYLPLLENFSNVDKYLAEIGLIRPITKPDVDNLEKTYLDALNDYIWDDDGLIIDGRTRKYYSIKPRVEIKIKYRNILLSSIFERYRKVRHGKN